MLVTLAVVAGVVAAFVLLRPRGEPPRTWYEEVRADHGPVPRVIHELGVLAPRDPVIARCPFNAKLQWVVEDGSWVEKGAEIYILSDEDEIKRVADLRSQFVQSRAELRLSRMKREHGEATERPKLTAAERALALAETRRRLLDARPKGGLELVRIAEALRPLAQRTATARAVAERAQDAYQGTLDAYLEQLDAWQGNRDGVLRLQARIDELEAGVGEEDDKAKAERTTRLAEARKQMEDLQAKAPELARILAAARGERDKALPARDAAAKALADCEAAEHDLRFAAEVEKLALPLARLQLDERQSVLEEAEAERKLEQTRVAVQAGSLPRSDLEKQDDDLRLKRNALAVVRAKLAIASRPLDPQAAAAADADLEKARVAADDARGAYQRAIALLDQDVALKEAQVARLDAQIESRSAGFPSVLEAGIGFAQRELALLGPDEIDERTAVEARLASLRKQYDEAKDAPPNVVKAPVAGLVRLLRNGDRPRQAGDQCWDGDALVEIYPPANMDVLLRVNQVDIGRLHPGMPARITIPALHDTRLAGEVVQVAGVGRDKFERPEYGGKAGQAGVVDFEARVHLEGTSGIELRQGMAVEVELALGEAEEVLRLPLAAVRRSGSGWSVLVRDGGGTKARAVEGAPVGPLWFAVRSGVAPGDVLLIERTRNR